jgi:hypothetical protein
MRTQDQYSEIDKEVRNVALALHSSSRPEPSERSLKKRPIEVISDSGGSSKRPRPTVLDLTIEDDQVKFINTTDRSSSSKPGLNPQSRGSYKLDDPSKLLTRFRIKTKKLNKKSEYQILYFPMTNPLTQSERMERREVVSTKIC